MDICEDPELKERIVHLRNEIETKKATHSQRLKRSHSQNTRSHSVRRTSIREKSQISRREALEEARLRQEQSEKTEEEDESKQLVKLNSLQNENDLNYETQVTCNNISSASLHNQPTNESSKPSKIPDLEKLNLSNQTKHNDSKDAVVIKNEGYCELDGGQHSISSSLNESSLQASNLNRSSSSGAESVKVEIHVTVNTSPTYSTGTLADLKKHRSEVRTRSLSNSDNSKNTKDLRIYPLNHNSSHLVSTTYRYDSPPSPSSTLKKFRGDPSEIVGEIQKAGCCKML